MTAAGMKIVGGVGLVSLAAFIPAGAIAGGLTSVDPRTVHSGTLILRATLLLEGLVLLLLPYLPAHWFSHPGLPGSTTGLRIGGGSSRNAELPVSRLALGAIVAVGAVARFVGLNRELWLDEMYTVHDYMRLPFWEIFSAFSTTNQHLLHSLLGSLSISFFGEVVWAIRLPAVLFGIGGIAALYFLAQIVTTEREALWATLFMALSYHHVWFSQNARGYSGMLLWSLMGTFFLLRGLARNRTIDWAGYVVSMTLGIMTLQLAGFVVLGQATAYCLTFLRWPRWREEHWPLTRRMLASLFWIGLLSVQVYSFIAPTLIEFFLTYERVGTAANLSSPTEFLEVAVRGLQTGFLGFGVILVAALVGTGGMSYWRQSGLFGGVLALSVFYGGLGILVLNYGAYPRMFLFALPFTLLLIVRGGMVSGAWVAARLWPSAGWLALFKPRLGTTLVAVAVLISSWSLFNNYRYPKQDFSGALEYAQAMAEPRDSVCGVGNAGWVYSEFYDLPVCHKRTPAELEALRRAGGSIWVLYTLPAVFRGAHPELHDYVTKQSEEVATFPGTLGEGTVYVVRLDGIEERARPHR